MLFAVRVLDKDQDWDVTRCIWRWGIVNTILSKCDDEGAYVPLMQPKSITLDSLRQSYASMMMIMMAARPCLTASMRPVAHDDAGKSAPLEATTPRILTIIMHEPGPLAENAQILAQKVSVRLKRFYG
ncbi:hypothetical protein BB8028_0001g03650 [Beauveria bassiana]|uniref:Uncharacterized protein n=1 Tax=Beauveria bassiana TaxID=176275 RepID=A0A2S7XWK0_BEABA|nr:hypothetical protein BB8028_0001g03650 [Beauveria bassiana]